MIMRGIKKSGHIILSFIAPAILLLIVFAIKGVYPFGSGCIAYYDMAQSYIPAYSHTWDVLHGLKSPFISFDAAMGCSMTDIAGFFIFFPTNLFLLFVSRANLLGAMSFFLIFKLMLVSGFMSLYVSKRTDNKLLIFLAGFAYATSGYIVQYYTNIYYLDSVILLPVLMYATKELLSNRKKVLYIIAIACLMLTNPQMILPVGLYMIITVFLELRQVSEKKSRATALLNLIVCTAIGIMISAFSLIPGLLQTAASARFERNSEGGFFDILIAGQPEFVCQKVFMLYGAEVAIAVIAAILISGKVTIGRYAKSLIVIALLMCPIAFENMNLLWHGGSYQHFPMRFAYILSFECILLVVDFLADKEISDFKYGNITQLVAVALIPLLCIVLWVFLSGFQTYGIRDLNSYNPYKIILLLLVIFYLTAVMSQKKIIRTVCITIMILVQGSLATFAFMAPTGVYSVEGDNVLAQKAGILYEPGNENQAFTRYKDRNVALTTNYGFIADKPSLGGWMNGINANLQEQMERMGYAVNYTRVLDNCGTVFTDAMLNVKKLYSETDPKLDAAYKKTDSANVYDCNYTLPECFFVGDEVRSNSRAFDYQNELFTSVTGVEDELFESYLFTDLDYDIAKEKETYQYTASIDVSEPSILYIFGEDYYADSYAFAVNKEVVSLPNLTDTDNKLYAKFFLNGMVEAGEYDEGMVDVSVFTNFDAPYNIYVGLMKLSVLEEGLNRINNSISVTSTVNKSSVKLEYESEDCGTLFIPIEYNEGWKIDIDGKVTHVGTLMNKSFIGIVAPPGKHVVTMRFEPKGLKAGIVLSVLGLLAFAVLVILDKKRKLDEIKAPALLWNVFSLAVAALFIFMYVIPVLSSVVSLYAGIKNALNA